jgi:hypothetical protein
MIQGKTILHQFQEEYGKDELLSNVMKALQQGIPIQGITIAEYS